MSVFTTIDQATTPSVSEEEQWRLNRIKQAQQLNDQEDKQAHAQWLYMPATKSLTKRLVEARQELDRVSTKLALDADSTKDNLLRSIIQQSAALDKVINMITDSTLNYNNK